MTEKKIGPDRRAAKIVKKQTRPPDECNASDPQTRGSASRHKWKGVLSPLRNPFCQPLENKAFNGYPQSFRTSAA